MLTLKNSHLEPRCILILPADDDSFERRLIGKGIYSEPQIRATLARVETYRGYNQNHPGFFDVTISSGDVKFLLFLIQWKKLCKSFIWRLHAEAPSVCALPPPPPPIVILKVWFWTLRIFYLKHVGQCYSKNGKHSLLRLTWRQQWVSTGTNPRISVAMKVIT